MWPRSQIQEAGLQNSSIWLPSLSPVAALMIKIRVLQTLMCHANRSYCPHDLSISYNSITALRDISCLKAAQQIIRVLTFQDLFSRLLNWCATPPWLTVWACSHTDYHFIGTDSLFGSDVCSPFYNLYKVQEMVLGHKILPSGGQPRDLAS